MAPLGTSFRGFNQDALQALVPVLAPTARREVKFEDWTYKLALKVNEPILPLVDYTGFKAIAAPDSSGATLRMASDFL